MSIPWQTINGSLRELGGGVALTDAVLDVLLKSEFDQLGLELDPDYAANERALLIASIRQTAAVSESEAVGLLDGLRRDRGLGPQRYGAFLRRNAMLRELARVRIIDSGSEITQADVRRRYEIVHGPRVSARIITVPVHREATAVRAQIIAQEGLLSDRFAKAAVAHSTDGTGSRGGLLEPISVADPAYEANIRRVIADLEPGMISSVIAFQNGFAILMLEEHIPASGEAFEDVADGLQTELESRQERIVMERSARELLAGANVRVVDPSLDWAWKGR